MTVEEWLGKDNQLGIDIWQKKYRNGDESFEEWLERVTAGNEAIKKLIREKKFLYGGRILAGRGVSNGRKQTYSNCFRGDTKILTKDGIKTLGELAGKETYVFSQNSWRKAEIKSFGEQDVVAITVRKRKTTKTFYVTKDHIWFARNSEKGIYREFRTEDLRPGMMLKGDLSKCFRTYKPSPFGVAHGFFYGDGDHTGNNRRVNFCGDKIELLQYFTPDTFGTSNGVTTICGIPKIFWDKPSLNETPSYLYGWLAGYFAADGSVDERGACVICSSKRSDLEFVQDVLCVLGIPSNDIRVQTRLSNLTGEISDVYILSLSRRYLNESFFVRSSHHERFVNNPPRITDRHWYVESISDVVDHCEVFCAVVPDTQSFCLEGNILTHNCYVVTPPEDNIESIFDCARNLARTYSYGGGCGVDISKLSPRGAVIHNAAKTTSGSVSFMDLYSLVTGLIGQSGRRGALMISLSCEHPDIEEFIEVKNNLDKVLYANISVRVTDAFMEAVTGRGLVPEDTSFHISFTREQTGEVIEKTIDARQLFEKLVENNWNSAEPGILFWDRIKNWNLLSNTKDFEFAGVNPCTLLCRA